MQNLQIIMKLLLIHIFLLLFPHLTYADNNGFNGSCTGTPGLTGNYYNNRTFTAPILLSRIDPTINYAWGNGNPGGGINNNNFSTEWSGSIYFPEDADYTFSLAHDDVFVLTIDGNEIYNSTKWTRGSNNFRNATSAYFATGTYPITIRFVEWGGGAYAKLAWHNNASITSRTIVPSTNLCSSPPAINTPPIITSNGGGETASVSIDDTSTSVTTVTALDAEGDTITYSISGADSGLFTIDSSSGALTLNTTGSSGDTYTVVVNATDTSNDTDSQTLTVEITSSDSGNGNIQDPEFIQCGLFPSALNTWDTINRGANDIVINANAIHANNGVSGTGNQDIECIVNGTSNDCDILPMPEDIPTLPTFINSTISGSYTATSNETNTSYADVSINSNSTVTFNPSGSYSNANPVMLIHSINIGRGATVTFSAGDYWIGSWTSAASVNIRTNGKVRLFINGDMDLTQNHIDFNYDSGNGSPANMFIFIYGNFEFASQGGGSQQDIAAYVYVEGAYTGNHNTANSHFKGAVSAVHNINLNNNHEYIYDDSGLRDGWGDCGCITVGFERPSYSIEENINVIGTEKFVETRIILSRALNYDVNVTYNTEDGDINIGRPARATDGDYRRKVNQSIVLRAGDTNVSLPIGIFNDSPIELDEHFFVQLSNPQPSDSICLSDINRTQINILKQNDAPICFEDHFDNGLDSKWRVLQSEGEFTPHIVHTNNDNRLRLTDKNKKLSTTITKDYEFETSQNLIIVEFDYYAYGGCGNHGGDGTYGADGIVNILFDSAVGSTPTPGGAGGSMGYAQWVKNTPGFEGGWLGLGIDEFGNFSNPTERRIGGPGPRVNAIAIRGDGNGISGYEFLAGATSLSPPVAAKRSDKLNDYSSGIYKMTIDARNPAHLYIRLQRDLKDGSGYAGIIDQFDAKKAEYNQGTTPDKVRYAISSGTGSGCNNHEISWIRLKGNCAIYGDAPLTGPFDAWDTFRHTIPNVPADKNISTKIVEKEFQLTLASLDETFTGYETKPGIGSNIAVAIYKPNTFVPISNIVNYDANVSAYITAGFNLSQAYEDVVVGFKLCATNEVPQGSSSYIYRLWPVANCEGQINDCTATTTGTPTWHICYSSDHFAVRPNRFSINTIPTSATPISAGKGYNINYIARDDKDQPTLGYSRTQGGSFQLTTALNPVMSGCQNDFIESNTTIDFKDGFHDGDINATYFNTIGDFNLTLHEIVGSEFANIDSDDTPFRNSRGSSEALEISPYTTVNNLHIVPSGYKITNSLKNAHKIGARPFTYLHDISGTNIKSMVGKLNLNIQAIIADDTNAENYEEDCYADSTTLKIDYNLSAITPNGSLTKLLYYIPDPLKNGQDPLNIPISTPNKKTLTIALAKAVFKAEDHGSVDINISLNFDRDRNAVVNPFDMAIGDINLTEIDYEVSTIKTNTDANITYLYARAQATQFLYDDVLSGSMITPIMVQVYCDKWPGTSLQCQGIDVVNARSEPYWWLSLNHNENSGDGNITLQVASGAGASVDTDVSVTSQAIDRSIVVTRNSGPTLVDINLTTTVNTDTNRWLIYNPSSPTLDPIPFYKVRFIGEMGWAGYGDTGHVIDRNITTKKNRRLGW